MQKIKIILQNYTTMLFIMSTKKHFLDKPGCAVKLWYFTIFKSTTAQTSTLLKRFRFGKRSIKIKFFPELFLVL